MSQHATRHPPFESDASVVDVDEFPQIVYIFRTVLKP